MTVWGLKAGVAVHSLVAVHNEFSQRGQNGRENLSSTIEGILLAQAVSEKHCAKKVKRGESPDLTRSISYIATVPWPDKITQHWCRK